MPLALQLRLYAGFVPASSFFTEYSYGGQVALDVAGNFGDVLVKLFPHYAPKSERSMFLS